MITKRLLTKKSIGLYAWVSFPLDYGDLTEISNLSDNVNYYEFPIIIRVLGLR